MNWKWNIHLSRKWKSVRLLKENTGEHVIWGLVMSLPAHSKGDQPWVSFGRNDAKAETPVLWPPHAKSWLTGKDSDAGRNWGQEEKGTTEDEMARWYHRLDGRESEWTPGVGDGQGGLACCDSGGRKESDTTPFPIRNQSVIPCPVLTVASWPAYRFLKGEIN